MTEARGEHCNRCGKSNVIWCAPSPLWNLVMRGNRINGVPRFGDLVCISCFVALAEEMGVANGQWRLHLSPEPEGLVFNTPSGRWWDRHSWLWREPGDGGDEVWCITCEHTHIPTIPVVTYLCLGGVDDEHGCGWGQWLPTDAMAHERFNTGHRTYPVMHQVVANPPPDHKMVDVDG